MRHIHFLADTCNRLPVNSLNTRLLLGRQVLFR